MKRLLKSDGSRPGGMRHHPALGKKPHGDTTRLPHRKPQTDILRRRRNPHADSVRSLITNFYYDQFRHFQDTCRPILPIHEQNSDLAMGIGGVVRMRGWCDWGGSVNSSAFAPYLIPIPSDPTHDKDLGTTPAGTSLFFRVLGRNKTLWQLPAVHTGPIQRIRQPRLQAQESICHHQRLDNRIRHIDILRSWCRAPTVDANGSNVSMDQTAVLVKVDARLQVALACGPHLWRPLQCHSTPTAHPQPHAANTCPTLQP